MLAKLITVIIAAACMFEQAKSASRSPQGANVAAVLLRDSSTGQLRFWGNGFGSAQINQLITNKQNFLEQLRPGASNGGNGGSGVDVITPTIGQTPIDTLTGTNIDTITNTDTGVAGPGIGITGTNAPVSTTVVDPTFGTRVRPIVVNANRGGSNRRRKPNRRRGNRRRGNKRRRGNNRPKIIVLRP